MNVPFIKLKCVMPLMGVYSLVHNHVSRNLNYTQNLFYPTDVVMTHGYDLSIHDGVSPKTYTLTFKSP